MNRSSRLRQELRELALCYAHEFGITFEQYDSAVIFARVQDSFLAKTYESILKRESWAARLKKKHTQAKPDFEMQSSNSSDALLMNIFCYPEIGRWRGVSKLLGCSLNSIEFGVRAKVSKSGPDDERTEIDMVLEDSMVEAKLTETGFTSKSKISVEKYSGFTKYFHTESLPQTGSAYLNYQLIRNLLAALQHNKKHILMCDQRRPDLVQQYLSTVICLKDVKHRKNCRVIYWQELANSVGSELQEFLKKKYGIV